eukprot:3121947-Prymnesium_polylepis.1
MVSARTAPAHSEARAAAVWAAGTRESRRARGVRARQRRASRRRDLHRQTRRTVEGHVFTLRPFPVTYSH